MWLGALAVGVPLTVGLTAGQPVKGILMAFGGLVGAMADRVGPYSVRMRRVAFAGAFAGAGLLAGAAINGRGWLAVAVLVVLAGVSALVSSISATWSTAGMFLLVYAALGTGPIGTLRPLWMTLCWVLAGVAWALVLMVPGRLMHPRAVEENRVAAVYRALAANMRAPGAEGFSASRPGTATALNVAYEELLGQRTAATGRDRRLARLVALLNQARLIADATAALIYADEQAPLAAATQADRLADAVLGGPAVPGIGPPPVTSPGMLALYDALDSAARVVSRRKAALPAAGDTDRPPERRGPLKTLAEQVRQQFAPTFAIRLMICIGVATVFSETLPLQRSYWVPLAVAVVLKPDFGSVFARALQYGAGTVVGAAIGALILAGYPPELALVAPVVVLAGLLPYGMSRNYGLFATFFTPLVVLLIELLTHGGWRLAEARLIDILLGCGVALTLGYAAWPSSWHADVPRRLADAIDQSASYLDLALRDRTPGAAASAHVLARRKLSTVRVEFQRTLAEPRPIRERVTAWWPTVIALEWLLEAIPATAVNEGGQRPPAAAVSELSAALRQIAGAVRAGRAVQPQPRLPRPPSLKLVSDGVHSVQDAVAATPLPPAQPLVPLIPPLWWRSAPGWATGSAPVSPAGTVRRLSRLGGIVHPAPGRRRLERRRREKEDPAYVDDSVQTTEDLAAADDRATAGPDAGPPPGGGRRTP
jgi:uncharacterized membrane protein YccC